MTIHTLTDKVTNPDIQYQKMYCRNISNAEGQDVAECRALLSQNCLLETRNRNSDPIDGRRKRGLRAKPTRESLTHSELYKDLKQSIGGFMGPFLGESSSESIICGKKENSNESKSSVTAQQGLLTFCNDLLDVVLGSAITSSHEKKKSVPYRKREFNLVTTSPNLNNLLSSKRRQKEGFQAEPLQSQHLETFSPFVTPYEFRSQLLADCRHSVPLRSFNPSLGAKNGDAVKEGDNDPEFTCRKELASSELLLEQLKINVACDLAAAQSLSQSVGGVTLDDDRSVDLEHTNMEMVLPKNEKMISNESVDDIGVLSDHWGDVENSTFVFATDKFSQNSFEQKPSSREMEQGIRDNQSEAISLISHFLDCSQIIDQHSDADLAKDPVERCEMILRNAQKKQGNTHRGEKDRQEFHVNLGHLAGSMVVTSEFRFPSRATTEVEYIAKLLRCPVLCFQGNLSFEDTSVLPHLKQDSKDLIRDVVQLNGRRISGSKGYTHIYKEVAKELLPSHLKLLYIEREYCDGIEPENKKLLTVNDNSMRENEFSDAVKLRSEIAYNLEIDLEFCVAEIEALILLHCASRTLSGGHCFEKVMEVFGNEICLVVPNSKAAQPLDIIVLRDCKGNPTAMIHSHTNFRIYPAAASPEASNCYAEVDAHFISDVPLVSIIHQSSIQKVCEQISKEIQLEDHNTTDRFPSERKLLSNRLFQFIASNASTRPTPPLNPIEFRVYLSVCSVPN